MCQQMCACPDPFLRQQPQDARVIIGQDGGEIAGAHRGDRHGAGVVRIVLLRSTSRQCAYPRRTHRRHIDHAADVDAAVADKYADPRILAGDIARVPDLGVRLGPAIHLDGLVFHLSRCGSTLIAQMLAALPWTVVASEPSVIDSAIRHLPSLSDASEQTHAGRLKRARSTAPTVWGSVTKVLRQR